MPVSKQPFERENAHIQEIFGAIRQLIEQPVLSGRQIGFKLGTQQTPAKHVPALREQLSEPLKSACPLGPGEPTVPFPAVCLDFPGHFPLLTPLLAGMASRETSLRAGDSAGFCFGWRRPAGFGSSCDLNEPMAIFKPSFGRRRSVTPLDLIRPNVLPRSFEPSFGRKSRIGEFSLEVGRDGRLHFTQTQSTYPFRLLPIEICTFGQTMS